MSEQITETDAVKRIKKALRKRFLCTVNPFKLTMYDFRKKRKVKHSLLSCDNTRRPIWPSLGVVCPICNTSNNTMKHYLVNRFSMCERCAIEHLLATEKMMGTRVVTAEVAEYVRRNMDKL